MVHEHANQLIAHRLVNQRRGNSRVDTARQTTDNAVIADLRANLFYLLGDNVARVPGWSDAGCVVQEILENLLAKLRVLHFWVPLHAINLALRVSERSHRSDVGRSQHLETFWSLHHLVAVAHPANLFGRLTLKNLAAVTHAKFGCAILFDARAVNATTEQVGKGLKAVANAKHRHAELENLWVKLWRAILVNRRRATRKNDGGRVLGAHLFGGHIVVNDFAVDAGFTNSTGNQLCVLRTKVDD